MTAPDPTDPGVYRHWTSFPIRFSDQDAMGHVNNVAYAAYFETGRLMYFTSLLAAFPRIEMEFVLASLHIDYLAEMHFPGEVRVGARVIRVGRSSIETGYAAFKDDLCCAVSTSVNVMIDTETRRARPFPDDVRAVMLGEIEP